MNLGQTCFTRALCVARSTAHVLQLLVRRARQIREPVDFWIRQPRHRLGLLSAPRHMAAIFPKEHSRSDYSLRNRHTSDGIASSDAGTQGASRTPSSAQESLPPKEF